MNVDEKNEAVFNLCTLAPSLAFTPEKIIITGVIEYCSINICLSAVSWYANRTEANMVSSILKPASLYCATFSLFNGDPFFIRCANILMFVGFCARQLLLPSPSDVVVYMLCDIDKLCQISMSALFRLPLNIVVIKLDKLLFEMVKVQFY